MEPHKMKSLFLRALTKRRLIVIVLSLLLVTWSARSCRKQSLADIEGVKSSPDSITPPGDVLALYKSELPKYLTRIGARSLFRASSFGVCERNGEQVKWTEDEVTSVDKLNGITQRHRVIHRFSFWRTFNADKNGWNDWGDADLDLVSLKIERRNGSLLVVDVGGYSALTPEDLKRLPNP